MKKKQAPNDTARRSNMPPPDVVQGEAAALSTLFEQHQRRAAELGEKVSQASFGADNEIGVQGMVWQYLNGHKPLNLEAAIKFATGLGVTIDAFSPRLSEVALRAAAIASGAGRAPGADRQGAAVAMPERMTKVTTLPKPFDHDRFVDLPKEQRRDIAKVAALMVDAFSRYNTPPEKRARPWGTGDRRVEATEMGAKKRRPPKNETG